ncbi:Putative HTH-type transcriptional regulator YwnA [Neobacillus rhizosphaerae]|uniref:HTH-type transcriptional regulator YwnA n=1 Tax=Neobacillus rhizosphaerae TaxID=2880965 RepID=A0ABM9ELH7_9BACI|nr:Rrf2 family transcriptional regulator [Neobacillus rhizosphaerae]CAH2713444.1 Putative HTH-type transcriptional regulator YwnA [Neobacillus rhizosphaerae]
MKNSRFAVAIHILSLASFQPRATSDFIASSVNTNPVVIRRISSMLKKAGLLTSQAGVPGVNLTKDPIDITLLEIYKAVQGKDETTFAMHEDPNPDCVVGRNIQATLENKFMCAQSAMENELARQTLDDILHDLFE